MTINNMIFVDGHVHVYNCFALSELLDSAHRNFREAARQIGADPGFTGILMLTETRSDHWFREMAAQSGDNPAGSSSENLPWTLSLLPDKCSLLALRESGEQLYLVAGRQVITSEGLEVLALATDRLFDDGQPVAELLENMRQQGAIPVIPWAVGKWLGKRGRILADIINAESGKGLYLGDNGGRPLFWRNITHFRQANDLGMPVLPGSDPLPFPSEISRVGSFGFRMQGAISNDQATSDIRDLIRNSRTDIRAYGRLDNPLHFLLNQVRVRLPRQAA